MTARDDFVAAVGRDDPDAARAAALAMLAERRDSGTVEFVARHVGRLSALPVFRLGLLATFTVFPLVSYLSVAHFLEGRRLEATVVEYGRWAEALGHPAELADVDAVVLLLHLEDAAPLLAKRHLAVTADELDAEARALIAEIADAVDGFRGHSNVPVAVSTFVAARRGIERHFDRRVAAGRQQRIDDINCDLGRMASDRVGVYVYDYAGLVADTGRTAWFDPAKTHHKNLPLTARALEALSRDLCEFLIALSSPRSKVVIVDLDNTMWGGVVGEDGPDGIAVGGDYPGNAFADFHAFLANMRATGVMVAIASKNNEADAVEAFAKKPFLPLGWDDFAAHRVNWRPKAENIGEICAELRIGTDSAIFIDDDRLECELVSAALPEVRVIHLEGPASLFPDRLTAGTRLYGAALTEDDGTRADSYAAERHRRRDASAGDPAEVLSRLGLQLDFRAPRRNEYERVSQLYAKTNQFNLTTRRLGLAEVATASESPDVTLRIARLCDRYGDYGIIGVVLRQGSEIKDFMMSCRALGRHVEDAILAEVEREARAEGMTWLRGEYRPTTKNGLVAEFYAACGFVPEGDGGWVRDLAGMPPLPFPKHITLLRSDSP